MEPALLFILWWPIWIIFGVIAGHFIKNIAHFILIGLILPIPLYFIINGVSIPTTLNSFFASFSQIFITKTIPFLIGGLLSRRLML